MWQDQEVGVVYMLVCEGKWVCLEGAEAKDVFSFLLTPIYISNQLPEPSISKTMKVCAMRTWLLQYVQTESLSVRHMQLCFNILESTDHRYKGSVLKSDAEHPAGNKQSFFCWQGKLEGTVGVPQ